MDQKAYIGRNSIDNLPTVLSECKASHVFLVRGKNSYKACGAEIIINDALAARQCAVTEFYDFSENPKYEDMLKGIGLLRSSGADVVMAVGGGSVMDMAKLIRFFDAYDGDVAGNTFGKKSEPLPLIALPTTAGTGAEATHFSVVYKDRVKYSAEHPDMLPDYAIVYPPFTYGNNLHLTACTGFDALAQAIEAFWNLNATDESDSYAEKAIRLLWTNLPQLVAQPDDTLRDKVSEGAYWAGRAINITKTTAPHAFSYPFTTHYGYPHGYAVALTFPYFFALNCSEENKDQTRVERLLALLSMTSSDDLQHQMQQYTHSLGLTFRPGDHIDRDLILANVNLDRLRNNPVGVGDWEKCTLLLQ